MAEVEAIHKLIEEVSPYYKKKQAPEAEHVLKYDSSSETLEPIYFFILDLMDSMGLNPEKLMDNFNSSPGSGHFGEMGQRASVMQQQGAKLLGDINTVLRSVLNIVYDLREFEIRLQTYKDLKDPSKEDAAILSLKQIWMDKVDVSKGNSSIKAMALSQAGFATLIDAFLAAKGIKDVDRLDLNDRVKRILKPRIQEFYSWLKHSESELKKRYEIEKTYLKSQINSLRLYSRWAKPYLKAAGQLETKDFGRDPALVKIFNTLLLELTLLGKRKLKIKETAQEGEFPSDFAKDKFLKKFKRDYYSCVLVDFRFRGIPNKVQGTQHFSFGGRTIITFRAYALNQKELDALNKRIEEDDLDSAFGLIKGVTEESLEQLKEDIEHFLGDEEEEPQKTPKDSSNPFLALFGKYNKKEEPKKEISSSEKDNQIIIYPDNWYEKEYFRPKVIEDSKETTHSVFDIYKKAHGMASFT